MINIGICDDNKSFCNLLRTKIDELLENKNLDYEIDIFNTCEEVIKEIEGNGHLEILFLDIEFPKMDGLELSNILRNNYNLKDLELIYISSHDNYYKDVFSYRPANFLYKATDMHRLEKVLIDSLKRVNDTSDSILIYYKKQQFKLKQKQIYYIVHKNRISYFHTVKKTYYSWDALTNVDSVLNDCFIYANRETIVNIEYINKLSNNKLTMIDNCVINISRRRKKEVKLAIHNYCLNKILI